MGQSLKKRKEGFPRERRFQELPTASPESFNRPKLRQPWALIAEVYRCLFRREGLSLRQVIASRLGVLVDRIINTIYRSLRALTVILHAALLIYCGATWTTFTRSTSLSLGDWFSRDYPDLLPAPASNAGKKIFAYSGGSWEHDYSAVGRILSSATRRNLGHQETKTLTEAIVTTARDHRVDPVFVATLIKHESGFRRSVVSSAGAIGLMQLLPSTGQFVCALRQTSWGGSQRLCTPSYNLKLGISYLKYLLNQFPHNLSHVLIAYNWGPGNLQRALKNRRTIPKGPVRYARSILRDYAKARSSQGGATILPEVARQTEIRKEKPVLIRERAIRSEEREDTAEKKRARLVF